MNTTFKRAVLQLSLLATLSLSADGFAEGFSIKLYDGVMHGPGNLGTHDINGGTLKNFVVTSPLSGKIKFRNNREADPNVYAESLHTGPVDGALSDGTMINENVDAAFVIKVEEPETKKLVELFICSVSEETVEPDEKGNLLFKLNAAFDTGFADNVITMPVQFTTGAVKVPKSDKTKKNLKGGNDLAGSYLSGTVHIGRLGDSDQDGFLDGKFMLAGNTPSDLIIVEGDPVLITRPFKSDIPVTPQEAFFYEINGIVQNFPDVLAYAIEQNRVNELKLFLDDIESRVEALTENLSRADKLEKLFGKNKEAGGLTWIETSSRELSQVKRKLSKMKTYISRKKILNQSKAKSLVQDWLSNLEIVQKNLVEIRGRLI